MLAPSKETSVQSHLPVPTSSQPVQIIATMLWDLQIMEDTLNSDADEEAVAALNKTPNLPCLSHSHYFF